MSRTRISIFAAGLVLLSSTAFADTYVNGYTRRDGTYVQPHMRSSPNSTTSDNWSTRGNVNPYTGSIGTKEPDDTPSYRPPAYQPYQVPAAPQPNPYAVRPYGR